MATILIVDDLAANRDVLATLLRYQGHEVIEATNGIEGLTAARAWRPHLVITDVLMPVMDGYELVRELRLDASLRETPVLFYTAHYSEREARDLALAGGVADVLTKPAEPATVLRLVNRVLAGQSAPPPVSLPSEFDREHLRLVTDKLSAQVDEVRAANGRLRALVNIGLELASERDAERLLNTVAVAARDLFAATYVTLGIANRDSRKVQRFVSCGVEGVPWIAVGDDPPGLLGTVVADRRTLRGINHDGDPAGLHLPETHPPITAYLAAPIVSPAHVYGWFCLVANEGQGFSDDDEQLVRALAGQVGRIYENGYFYSVARQRADELQEEVSRRRRTEMELREERNRAQRYLDGAEVILLALDLEGRITLVNRYACALLGWGVNELMGRDWIDACVPARLHDLVSKRFEPGHGDEPLAFDHPVVTREGDERLIAWRSIPLRDDSGALTGTLRSGTDITTRHVAVEALRATEERMRFALESANIGIWDMDCVTGHLQWSETLEAHYGLAPGTFGGRLADALALIHPDDRAATAAAIERALATGTDFRTQHRSAAAGGRLRWLEGAGRVLTGPDGVPVRAVGITMDVTERRSLEAQYQQAQKMEAIGRLAGGVAHDFNNLLTAILGYCELLLDDYGQSHPRRDDIAQIQKAGVRAAALTQQLLAFSRKQIIAPTVLDLNALVADVHAMLRRLIGEDVEVRLWLEAGLPPVHADRGQLEQVVLNLAVNARDAMPHGGILTIETASVDARPVDGGMDDGVTAVPHVALTVTDTGTGMAPDVKTRIFEPFFTTKEPGRGTGLGLSTVHGIVSRNGGFVEVDSKIGRGSSFRVYFPAAAGVPVVGDDTPPPRHALPGKHTVLVVEDAAPLRVLIGRLLERLGYRALSAASAEQARQEFANHPDIDVLLVDVVMPGTSGPSLVGELSAQRPDVRVIFMSGYTEDAIVHHGVLKPGVTLLNKPFSAETLGQKIRDVLGDRDERAS